MKSCVGVEDTEDSGSLEMAGGFLMCICEVNSKTSDAKKTSTRQEKIIYGLVVRSSFLSFFSYI